MNENKNTTEEIIRNVEDEASDLIGKREKDISEEVEEFEDIREEEDVVPEIKKKESKQQKTIRLVKQAKALIKVADASTEECRLLLMDSLAEYRDAKMNLKERGFDTCNVLLEKMGYKSTPDVSVEEEAIIFQTKAILEPMMVKEVSSGKFTGVLSALITGSVAAVGLVYLATEKLGMTLDVTKVPSAQIMERIAGWFSTLIGLESNMVIGAGIFGLCVLLVMVIVYSLRVNLKANSNLHFAVRQFVEAELYAENKSDCKAEVEKVTAHMKETIKTLKTCEILFNEQQGKLQRILYIEGEREQATEYHEKSFVEIDETKELIRIIKEFMSIPMLEEGKLSEASGLRLEKIKTQMDQMIERLYRV